MVNWKEELNKYIAKKLSTKFGYIIDPSKLSDLELNDDINIDEIQTQDLIMVYSFALMSENFEKADRIKERLKNDGYGVKIVVEGNSAVIEQYEPTDETLVYSKVYMIITPDGMIMDFERQNF